MVATGLSCPFIVNYDLSIKYRATAYNLCMKFVLCIFVYIWVAPRLYLPNLCDLNVVHTDLWNARWPCWHYNSTGS